MSNNKFRMFSKRNVSTTLVCQTFWDDLRLKHCKSILHAWMEVKCTEEIETQNCRSFLWKNVQNWNLLSTNNFQHLVFSKQICPAGPVFFVAPRCLKDIGGKVKDRRLPGHLQNARNSRIFLGVDLGMKFLCLLLLATRFFAEKPTTTCLKDLGDLRD